MKREAKFNKGMKRFISKLPEDQIQALELIHKKTLTILWGKAGTGKTFVGVYAALQMLDDNKIEKILVTRPTVSDESIGFLPGTVNEKMEPWVIPIYENFKTIIGSENTKYLIDKEILSIKPVSFMRGQTFNNSAIIVDEAQNVTHKQMEMIVGRLGKHSSMIICGDLRQKDLNRHTTSGFPFLLNGVQHFPEVGNFELTTNHRNPLVDKLLTLYKDEEYDLGNKTKSGKLLAIGRRN